MIIDAGVRFSESGCYTPAGPATTTPPSDAPCKFILANVCPTGGFQWPPGWCCGSWMLVGVLTSCMMFAGSLIGSLHAASPPPPPTHARWARGYQIDRRSFPELLTLLRLCLSVMMAKEKPPITVVGDVGGRIAIIVVRPQAFTLSTARKQTICSSSSWEMALILSNGCCNTGTSHRLNRINIY